MFVSLLKLASTRDPYAQHQLLWTCFLRTSDRPFQFRVIEHSAGSTFIKALADQPPRANLQVGVVACTLVALDAFVVGTTVAFGLTASPTTTLRNRIAGLREPEQQLQWLQRKVLGAASVRDVRVVSSGGVSFVRRGRAGTFGQTQFSGSLVVTDAAAFTALLRAGIGRHKGLGSGMLDVFADLPSRAAVGDLAPGRVSVG